MKKEYVKPNLEVVEVIISSMIAASAGGNLDIEEEPLANEKRAWGNLWN